MGHFLKEEKKMNRKEETERGREREREKEQRPTERGKQRGKRVRPQFISQPSPRLPLVSGP